MCSLYINLISLLKRKSCPDRSLLTVKIEIWPDCFRREQTNQSFIQCHSAKVFLFYVQYWMVYLLAPPLVKAIQVSVQFLFYCFAFLCFFSTLVPRACLTFKSSGLAWISVSQKKLGDEGTGKNHERLKKSPLLPGKHVIEEGETEFLSPQRYQRKSFRRQCLYE